MFVVVPSDQEQRTLRARFILFLAAVRRRRRHFCVAEQPWVYGLWLGLTPLSLRAAAAPKGKQTHKVPQSEIGLQSGRCILFAQKNVMESKSVVEKHFADEAGLLICELDQRSLCGIDGRL